MTLRKHSATSSDIGTNRMPFSVFGSWVTQRMSLVLCGCHSTRTRRAPKSMSAIARPQNSAILSPVLNRMKSTNVSKLCMSRWGMPNELAGLSRVVTLLRDRGLKPVGNAFDFCRLDTTSYDESPKRITAASRFPSSCGEPDRILKKTGGRETSSARSACMKV